MGRSDSQDPEINEIHTVTIGTTDIETSQTFYMGLGFGSVIDTVVEGPEAENFWGLPAGGSAHIVHLKKHVDVGCLRLVQFEPPTRQSRQDPARPYRVPGINNINLYVDDIDGCYSILSKSGWRFISEPHDFCFSADITPREAAFFGPDDVMIDLVEPAGRTRVQLDEVAQFPGDYSEVVTSSQTSRDIDADIDFYSHVLRWDKYIDLDLRDPDVNAVIGLPRNTRFRLVFFKRPSSLRGKIAIGSPLDLPWEDLPPNPVRPNGLGLLLLSMRVGDADWWFDRLRRMDAPVILDTGTPSTVSPLGIDADPLMTRTRSILTAAPNGALIELFSPVT